MTGEEGNASTNGRADDQGYRTLYQKSLHGSDPGCSAQCVVTRLNIQHGTEGIHGDAILHWQAASKGYDRPHLACQRTDTPLSTKDSAADRETLTRSVVPTGLPSRAL